MEMLRRRDIAVAGKNAVVLGRSDIVGKPMAMLLLNASATVTICHSKTADLPRFTRAADILVAAIGRPGFVTPDMVKPGAVLVDVGINRITEAAQVAEFFPGNEARAALFAKRGLGSSSATSIPPAFRVEQRVYARSRRRRRAHHRHADVEHRARRATAEKLLKSFERAGLLESYERAGPFESF